MEHTKGPWSIKNGRVVSAPHSGEDYASGGSYVAISIGNQSDANLICAAPDLLDVAKRIVEWMNDNGYTSEDQSFGARAAIAKAEGKTA